MRRWWRRDGRATASRRIGPSLALALLTLVGCGTTTPTINPVAAPPGKAVVHVFRPGSLYAVLGYPYVYVDGREQFPLAANDADALVLAPGRHVIRVAGDRSNWGLAPGELTLDVEAGREYFVRVEPVRTAPFAKGAAVPSGYTSVELVGREKAVGEGRPAPRRGDAAAPVTPSAPVPPPGAATTGSSAPEGAPTATTPARPGYSAAGRAAMRAIQAARVALLDGQTDVAGTRLAEAERSLALAAKDTDAARPGPGGVTRIAIDDRLTIEGDVPLTPANAGPVARANQFIAEGDKGRAAAELRAAGIPATASVVLLPLQPTRAAIDDARRLLAAGRFLEANAALKAAEDGLILDAEGPPPSPPAKPRAPAG